MCWSIKSMRFPTDSQQKNKKCGTILDRDHNTSRNILQKALDEYYHNEIVITVGQGCVRTV